MRGPREVSSSQETSPSFCYHVIWSPGGTVLHRSPSAPADVPRADSSIPVLRPLKRNRGQFRELVEVSRRGFCVVVGHDMARDRMELRRLAWRMAATVGGVLTLGLLCGWWLASRAIKPTPLGWARQMMEAKVDAAGYGRGRFPPLPRALLPAHLARGRSG